MAQTDPGPAATARVVTEIPEELKQRLRLAAARTLRDQKDIVADAISEYLDRHDL